MSILPSPDAGDPGSLGGGGKETVRRANRFTVGEGGMGIAGDGALGAAKATVAGFTLGGFANKLVPNRSRRGCLGSIALVPSTTLGRRSSYGMIRSGGEAGWMMVCRVLSGRGGFDTIVCRGWKAVLPSRGSLVGSVPRPGRPPGPGARSRGKYSPISTFFKS